MANILLLPTVEPMWKFLGYNLNKTTRFMNFYTTLAFFLVLVVPILGAMLLIFDDFSLNALADTFESCGPNYQLLSKIVINRYFIGMTRHLLQQIEHKFWPMDKFGPALERQQLKITKLVTYSYKVYCYIMYCTSIMICARPLFLKTRRYPLASYNIVDVNNTPFYMFLYSFHIFDFIYGVGMLLAVDGMFAVFVTNILCQIVMLQHAFKSLNIHDIQTQNDEDVCYKKLREYVDHHNEILEFISNLNKLYSVQMFNQLIGNTASICMGIYIISNVGHDLSAQIRSSLILATFIAEMAIYCTGGTLMETACSEIPESIYESGWEGSSRKKFRVAALMIILRAQKPQGLRAGGLYDINVITLIAILRTSFSFYTLMSSVSS